MRLESLGIGVLAACVPAVAQVEFSPIFLPGGGAFDADFGMIHGVAAADYDNDGDIDLFLPTGEGQPNQYIWKGGEKWTITNK